MATMAGDGCMGDTGLWSLGSGEGCWVKPAYLLFLYSEVNHISLFFFVLE